MPGRQRFYAHSGLCDDRSDWQGLEDHLQATAGLAAERGAPLGLSAAAALAGYFHDFGKFDPAFDQVLQGKNVRVNHSTAGGRLLCTRAPPPFLPVAEVIAQAILGHHAGLPDARGDAGSMGRRFDAFEDAVPRDISAAAVVELGPAAQELARLCRRDAQAGFDLSLAGRMIFSCLVDADYRDTEAFYDQLETRDHDRDWPALQAILAGLRAALEQRLAGFDSSSELNRLRAEVLAHMRERASMAPGLFTLTVPTGGGKTLASMAFALDHAQRHGHRRILYAIPYTSIIDQTAAQFRELFGDVVLEHHAAIDDEGTAQCQRDKLRLAMEDWAAPIVVTTNVQLFESLFAARPGRCRKLHNIAGSVIVLDEAQCLPRPLLLPTLRMIEALSTHYGCSVVLCTATQPAFDSRQLKAGGLALAGRELAPDPAGLVGELRRARIVRGGAMEDAALIEALAATDQGMVIVNSRAHALALFEQARSAGLEGLVHLTTRQYPVARSAIIADIRARLAAGKPCRLIATSLIEAGVDLDFPRGWRAEAGLDSIVQAAGRVNREGMRPLADSTLTVFDAPGQPVPASLRPLIAAMRRTWAQFEDLLSTEAIAHWFDEVYWRAGSKALDTKDILGMFRLGSRALMQYRSAAEAYRMIDQAMVPVIIAIEDEARAQVARLSMPDPRSGGLARALQRYTVQVPERARAELLRNRKAAFVAPDLRGDQFCLLTENSLYRPETGLWWEGAGYLADGIW